MLCCCNNCYDCDYDNDHNQEHHDDEECDDCVSPFGLIISESGSLILLISVSTANLPLLEWRIFCSF